MEKSGRSREQTSFDLGYLCAKKGFEKSQGAYSRPRDVPGELKQ